MPFLGAGVDQHVNPAVTPTWVFTPTPNAPSTVRLYNEGSNPVYVGDKNVSQFNGLQVLTNNRPIELVNATQTVYACSGVQAGATTKVVTAPVTAGTTVLTLSGGAAGFPTGTVFILGNTGLGQEVLVSSGTGATSLTATTAFLYDHSTSSTVTTATMLPAQLRVTAGVV
jgi:hypothetical protein